VDDLLARIDQKKQRLDKLQPLPSDLIKNLDEWYRVELTYTSNAIEGNTLSRRETALVVDKGLTIQGKSLVEHLEAVNHAEAVDYIRKLASHTKPNDITQDTILEIHKFILSKIDDTNAGRYRNVPIRVTGSSHVFPNHMRVAELMTEFIQDLHEKAKTMHPCLLASYAHYTLVGIHPFVDGNGRTARLLMNLILQQCGYPPAIIRKEDRLKYINALEQGRIESSMTNFDTLISGAVEHSLDIYLGEDKQQVSGEAKLLKIGDLARLTDETVVTLRHWTDKGLLQLADRSTGGYRLYDEKAVERIKEIRKLQRQRLSLAEIMIRLKPKNK
jgi:Fic family protein